MINYRNITGSGGALFSVKPKSALIGDPNDTWGEAIGEASEKTWRMGKHQLAPSLLVTPWCQVTRLVKKTQDARTNNMVVQKTNEINRRLWVCESDLLALTATGTFVPECGGALWGTTILVTWKTGRIAQLEDAASDAFIAWAFKCKYSSTHSTHSTGSVAANDTSWSWNHQKFTQNFARKIAKSASFLPCRHCQRNLRPLACQVRTAPGTSDLFRVEPTALSAGLTADIGIIGSKKKEHTIQKHHENAKNIYTYT